MPFPCKPADCIVPPPRTWRQRKAFYAFVLVATTAAVYLAAKAGEQRPTGVNNRPTTATVRCRAVTSRSDGQGQTTLGQQIDLAAVQRSLTSPAALADAIRRSGMQVASTRDEGTDAAVQQAAARARDQVRVTVDSTTPEAATIAITCGWPDPQAAAGLANALAQQCAEACRTLWKASSQRACGAAREDLDHTERDLREAKTRLDQFRRQAIQPAGEDNGPATASEGRTYRAVPKLVENPEWSEIQAEVERLRSHRMSLLVNRLPSHPAVAEVELRLRDLEGRLAAIRRWASPPDEAPAEAPNAGAVPAESAWPRAAASGVAPLALQGDRVAATERLQELRRTVTDAERARYEASQRERGAWEALRQEPEISVESARADAQLATAGFDLRLLLAAAAAAAAVTAGLGMVLAGARTESLLTSVGQVEAIAPVPVCGVLPAMEPGPPALSVRRQQSARRLVLILSGLTVVAACLGTLWMTLGGSP